MSDNISNNKRIAKNTMILYLRMLCTVGISFYTTRLILINLGVSDYGLYGIIASATTMLYSVTSPIEQGVGRFLTFGLGRGDMEELRKVFSTSVILLLGFSLFILMIGETVGLWYINNKLNIAEGRLVAANFVYQFVLLSFILDFICIAYDSCIVAHERMKAFAFVTVLRVFINFAIAFSVGFVPCDRLIAYALLMCLCSVVMRFVYYYYCRRNFEECCVIWHIDRRIFKNIFSYAGWTLLSTTVVMLSTTGISLVVNFFWGTVINAAQNVAGQIRNLSFAFTRNFSIAFNPQIIKSYAAGDEARTVELLYMGSKISYLLLFVLALPIMFEIDFILDVWLKEVPPYTTQFVILGLLTTLCASVVNKNDQLNAATGKIKIYHLAVALSFILSLPMAYFFFSNGFPPYWGAVAILVANVISVYLCIKVNTRYVAMSFRAYVSNVFVPLFLITCLNVLVVIVPHLFLPQSWWRMILTFATSIPATFILSYCMALNKAEQLKVRHLIFSKIIGACNKHC